MAFYKLKTNDMTLPLMTNLPSIPPLMNFEFARDIHVQRGASLARTYNAFSWEAKSDLREFGSPQPQSRHHTVVSRSSKNKES